MQSKRVAIAGVDRQSGAEVVDAVGHAEEQVGHTAFAACSLLVLTRHTACNSHKHNPRRAVQQR
jgi:hypothetical protein